MPLLNVMLNNKSSMPIRGFFCVLKKRPEKHAVRCTSTTTSTYWRYWRDAALVVTAVEHWKNVHTNTYKGIYIIYVQYTYYIHRKYVPPAIKHHKIHNKPSQTRTIRVFPVRTYLNQFDVKCIYSSHRKTTEIAGNTDTCQCVPIGKICNALVLPRLWAVNTNARV